MQNVKWLRALQVVVASKSLTEAAERLYVTQSAVSRMIASLEKELGFALFSRVGGRLSITPQGEAFYIEAERALAGLDEIGRVGAAIRTGGGIYLRIFAMSSFVSDLLPDALERFIADYPTIGVSIDIRGGRDSFSWDAGRRFDIGFVVLPLDQHAPQTQTFAQVPMLAAMRKDHPLARRRSLTLAELAPERLILTPPTSLLRRWIDGQFAAVRHAPQSQIEISSLAGACLLAAQGAGIALAEPLSVYGVRNPDLITRPLQPAMKVSLSFVLRADRKPSAIAERFMTLARESSTRVLKRIRDAA
jgi:DNA-binding transcriptional LysR family regulator